VVIASFQPAIGLTFKRHLECGQNAIQISHHLIIREAHYSVAMVSLHLAIASNITVGIVGVAINFDDQAFGWTKEIDNSNADHSLPPELESTESTVAQFHPDSAFWFRHVAAHLRSPIEQALTRRTTTPNPLL
jgi:hypothetical protein